MSVVAHLGSPLDVQFIKPLSTLKGLHTLRLCGISSDSSTLPAPPLHALKLTEVVLIEVKYVLLSLRDF